jgi:hypothetical protein
MEGDSEDVRVAEEVSEAERERDTITEDVRVVEGV